jgi:hypothetical protein
VSLDFVARREPESNGRDRTEQSVSTDCRAKELSVLRPTATPQCALMIHERECDDVVHERRQLQAAAVNVGGQRSSDTEPVSARLLLDERPGAHGIRLSVQEVTVQCRPLDTRLDLDLTLRRIEFENAPHAVHIEHDGVSPELLTAHCMSARSDTHRYSVTTSGADRSLELVQRRGPCDGTNARRVEL